MLWASAAECRAAEAFREGDAVLGVHGGALEVRSRRVYPEALCEVVRLKTKEAQLEVSACHRVAVPAADGTPSDERRADWLQRGDHVFCGLELQPLVKIQRWSMRTELVELQFEPDLPVASFNAPRWSIATRGAEPGAALPYPSTDDEWR